MHVQWRGVAATTVVALCWGVLRGAVGGSHIKTADESPLVGSTFTVREEEGHDATDGRGSLYGIRLRSHLGSTDDKMPRFFVRASSSSTTRQHQRRRLQSIHYNLFDLAKRNKALKTKSPKSIDTARPSTSPAPSTTYVPTARSYKSPKGGYPVKTRAPSSSSKLKKGSSLSPTASLVPTQTAVPSYSYSSKHKLSTKGSSKHASKSPKGALPSPSPVPTSSPVPTTATTITSPPAPILTQSPTASVPLAPSAAGPTTATPTPASPTSTAMPIGPISASPNTVTTPPVAVSPSSSQSAVPTAAAAPNVPTTATTSAPATTTASPVPQTAPQAAPAASAVPFSTTTTIPTSTTTANPSLGSPVAASPTGGIVTPTVSAPVAGAPTSVPSTTAPTTGSSSSLPPAVRSAGQPGVRSFVFGVTYELGETTNPPQPNADDFQAASDLTIEHLDQCVQSSPASHVKLIQGSVLGTSFSAPIQIEYELSVEFEPNSTSVPTPEQMTLIFEACLVGPHEVQLLQGLGQELDASNPFSAVKSVSYTSEDSASTPPPELSSERSTNSSQIIRITPFYMSFIQAVPNDSQDYDDVQTVIRNHIYVCLRHQYNRSVDVDGLHQNVESTAPLVLMNWTGLVSVPGTLSTTIPTALKISSDIVRCFEDPILNEVFIRKLQNLPESNGFSTTSSVSCSLSESSPQANSTGSKSSLSPGAIAGIAAAAIFYVVTHVMCFYYLYQKRKNRSRTDNCGHSAAPSQPPTTLAWVQLGGPGGWWSRLFGENRRHRFWPASRRGRTSESDVPRLLSMPYHHSQSGSNSRDGGRRKDDENLMHFMREIDADVIQSAAPTKKSAKQARL